MSTATDGWIDVHDERESLLTLLKTLTPVEWNTQSLRAEWRVRDVLVTWSARPLWQSQS
jgi:hypothetical protein